MVVWGVVSSEIEQVIEFFRTRREAERMLAEVVRDEPNWQDASTSSASNRLRVAASEGQPICVSRSPREATK